jgi:hypothetical protein
MEDLDIKSKKHDFLGHLFNFDHTTKSELLNITQFTILIFIFLGIYTEFINKFIPPVDSAKGTIEIILELFIHVMSILFGIFFINRIITFIPTYSGLKYQDINYINLSITIIFTYLIFESILLSKIKIIVNRTLKLWNGGKNLDDDKKTNNNVKVLKPLSDPIQNQPLQQPLTNYSGTTSLSQLPPVASQGKQQYPDYNEMYSGNGGEQQQQQQQPQMNDGIMAANELLGGSMFGSNF